MTPNRASIFVMIRLVFSAFMVQLAFGISTKYSPSLEKRSGRGQRIPRESNSRDSSVSNSSSEQNGAASSQQLNPSEYPSSSRNSTDTIRHSRRPSQRSNNGETITEDGSVDIVAHAVRIYTDQPNLIEEPNFVTFMNYLEDSICDGMDWEMAILTQPPLPANRPRYGTSRANGGPTYCAFMDDFKIHILLGYGWRQALRHSHSIIFNGIDLSLNESDGDSTSSVSNEDMAFKRYLDRRLRAGIDWSEDPAFGTGRELSSVHRIIIMDYIQEQVRAGQDWDTAIANAERRFASNIPVTQTYMPIATAVHLEPAQTTSVPVAEVVTDFSDHEWRLASQQQTGEVPEAWRDS